MTRKPFAKNKKVRSAPTTRLRTVTDLFKPIPFSLRFTCGYTMTNGFDDGPSVRDFRKPSAIGRKTNRRKKNHREETPRAAPTDRFQIFPPVRRDDTRFLPSVHAPSRVRGQLRGHVFLGQGRCSVTRPSLSRPVRLAAGGKHKTRNSFVINGLTI